MFVFFYKINMKASIACFFGTYLKRVTKYKFDDTANVFASEILYIYNYKID